MTYNIAHLCTRAPCQSGSTEQPAYLWVHSDLSTQTITYGQLERQSNRVAGALRGLGLLPGQCVSIFLPKTPELAESFFAILKNEAVACLLFSTFGESALFDRLGDNQSGLVITKKSLLGRLLKACPGLPHLRAILVTDLPDHQDNFVLSLPRLAAAADESFDFNSEIDPEAPAFIQYTSGSTGKPKGALHVHAAGAAMLDSFEEVFQLQPDDIYWCTADPAWITGLVYGLIAPLALQVRQIHFGGAFNARAWLSILQQQRVNVWYTAPTALRMLMQEERSLFSEYDTSALQRIYSVGEPLNPEVYHWGRQVFAREIYDNWFQSETGSIMISNRPGLLVKPGSMGKPLSTIEASIRDESMRPAPVRAQGRLCLRSGWASMFRTYLNKESLYLEKFAGEIYISGDLAYQDEDGYFWYVSRADDVINTAGHLVGPFEVESALLEIEEIADVAVIGVPDAILHEKIVAYLVLKKRAAWSRDLELKCRLNISNKISTTATPQEYHIARVIPKNKSGKILRRVLKAWYEGKDPGDLSTMEEA